jgi:class 3 adenylate cyclase
MKSVKTEGTVSTIKVLFLAANPSDTPQVALDEELRAIASKIRASTHRDALQLISHWALRPEDLQQVLLESRPDIVHFSGHGSKGQVALKDDKGRTKPVSTAALADLFKALKDNVKLAVLNSCFSRDQAAALVQHIDCAIGMKAPVGDNAAVQFAAAFYRAIGFGRSVQEAFDLGRNELLLQGIPQEHVPELLARKGVDPAEVILVPPGDLQGTIQVVRADAVEKAVVVVDLSRYSDIARELEQHFDASAVKQLNDQIHGLILAALARSGTPSGALPYKGTGDGAIIALDTAEQASQFAEALHRTAEGHNRTRQVPLAQRHFRVGIWTDPIILVRQTTTDGREAGFDFAGSAIANAVRLEGACLTGEVLISPDTWGDLPREMRRLYGDQEEVRGKRGERFRAHRRKVVDPAPWDRKEGSGNAGGEGARAQRKAGRDGQATKPAAVEGPGKGMGAVKRYVCSKLVNDWQELADHFEIPLTDRGGFRHGREAQGVWEWLEVRGRLAELPAALEDINRPDLAKEFRS